MLNLDVAINSQIFVSRYSPESERLDDIFGVKPKHTIEKRMGRSNSR